MALPHNALNVYVDVRDLVWAHVKALDRRSVSGQRIIVSEREVPPQRIYDLLRERFHELKERTPMGKPGTNDIAKKTYCEFTLCGLLDMLSEVLMTDIHE